jgi:hypothetical protein
MTALLKRLLFVAAPAAIVAAVVAVMLIEIWVRVTWDERRGLPGFYLSDPVLGQRLAPGYRGWFAGVPVAINQLGFRDPRDYAIDKPPGTFRILVLGDSVTFGHGALLETTYPYLLEQQLKAWRKDVRWEVWNLGVPGYNTRTEFEYLRRVGPEYSPDLVIVGFFLNDLSGNAPVESTLVRRSASMVQRAMQRWLYSYEFYRRVALTMRHQWLTGAPDRGRLEVLAGEEALLAAGDRTTDPRQHLTELQPLADAATFVCREQDHDPVRDRLTRRLEENDAEISAWRAAVGDLHQLHRAGQYRIVFFINMAPNECPGEDRYFDGGALEDSDALQRIVGDGTPATSSVRAFLRYRPSEMPLASGHAIGNANRVKADALFEYLSTTVLPPLLPR